MDDKSFRTAPPIDREIEQAIVALKKGAHLLKYGRRGKPKFCPFRLSADENCLIWYSGKEERQLKLSSVTKIKPGQCSVNFQRQPQPDKECQSFSLIYGNGDRTLDLICKDKDQAECWFAGLTTLVSRSRHTKYLAHLRYGRGAHSCASSPVGHTRSKRNLGLLEDSVKTSQVRSLCGSPRSLVGRGFSDGLSHSSDSFYSSESRSLSDMQSVPDNIFPHFPKLEVDYCHEKMGERLSLHGSFGSSNLGSPSLRKVNILRDVLMWGEGIQGGVLGGGVDTSVSHSDSLLPKLIESTCMLDVQNIACGEKHAVVVTRQGEVFCWGEEKNGRLGHKVNLDVSYPKIVESLTDVHVESIACGDYQTCALTFHGELYTWGENGHGVGLGHGNSRSRWLPHRVMGPLEGIRISTVACGEWHTAVVSSNGQLFTYGDGTFGVLGHGNLQSCFQPKEVESLKGLRVKSVACGPWHTAAIVEIMIDRFKGSAAGGKLFTWGDGDKGRLGHTDEERKLLPTYVAPLVDLDFIQVSCGRMLTVALTVTGTVFTMGSAVHGQLGNPQAEHRSITIVEGNLKEEFVKEISSGSYHVVVLTSKGNVYTWGMGANGRLGLGDIDDRSSPTLVEALKDRQVCNIACGSRFTAAICLHKSISSSDQSICSGCRMLFGFTRKKHNCYNCGFLFCHACSSKKALNASLAPNKSKQYRVCDPCFTQLSKHIDSSIQRQETPSPRPPLSVRKLSSDLKVDWEDATLPRSQLFSPKLSAHEKSKCNEWQNPSSKGRDQQSLDPVLPSLSIPPQWRQVPCPAIFSTSQNSMTFVPPSKEEASTVFPVYTRQSPTRLRSKISSANGLKNNSTESDEMLTEEVMRLRAEAKNLAKLCQMRSEKIQQYQQKLEETWYLAREEAAKCKTAKEVIKALTTRLNAMSEKVWSDREPSNINSMADKVDVHLPQTALVCSEPMEANDMKSLLGGMHSPLNVRTRKDRQNELCGPPLPTTEFSTRIRGEDRHHGRAKSVDDSRLTRTDGKQDAGNGLKTEWIEQDEPGVYITFMTLPCGQKGLKRVRFSRKRFSEKEAERWWEENQLRVYQKYNIEGVVNSRTNKISS